MKVSNISVLVIDDNADLAENIAEILEDIGVDVHLAENADAALALFAGQSWDLVVTDVRMPGLDGIELLTLIKERSPSTPVLVMTGFADRETVSRAHESGALAVVHKPLDLDALLELVERIAAAQRRVLIVEDDVALVGNLTDVLAEQDGLFPHPATNVALARKLASAIDFEVALIDLRLPDGDGLTLARELLERPDGSKRAIILITGYPEQLLESEPDERLIVMTKPVPTSRLLAQLREMLP